MTPKFSVGFGCSLIALFLTSCVDNRIVVDQDAAADSKVIPSIDASVDNSPPPLVLDGAIYDSVTVVDAGGCVCQPADEAYLIGSCVPTHSLSTCGKSCDPKVENSCGDKWVCDENAGTPTCFTSSLKPACVPGQNMVFDDHTLRISPTHGVAGQAVTLTVRGGHFYIGALFWVVSMGGDEAISEPAVDNCNIDATFTPMAPGIYPVFVGYGSSSITALAGFYTASAGLTPPNTIQPGFPCTPKSGLNVCTEGGGYTCTCDNGRCNCTGP
jgi:hypothetical protein